MNERATKFLDYAMNLCGPEGVYEHDPVRIKVAEALVSYLLRPDTEFKNDEIDRKNIRNIVLTQRKLQGE